MTTLLGAVLYIGMIYSPAPLRWFVTTDKAQICKTMVENMGAHGAVSVFTVKLGTYYGELKPVQYADLCVPAQKPKAEAAKENPIICTPEKITDPCDFVLIDPALKPPANWNIEYKSDDGKIIPIRWGKSK